MKNKNKSICKTYSNGTKYWYLNGELHREDGPAIEWPNQSKAWYLNGKLHREAGPAVEISNGTKYWYLNDKKYTEEEYYKELFKMGKITKNELFIHLI